MENDILKAKYFHNLAITNLNLHLPKNYFGVHFKSSHTHFLTSISLDGQRHPGGFSKSSNRGPSQKSAATTPNDTTHTHTLGLSNSPVGILEGSLPLPASAVVRDYGRRWLGSQAAGTAEQGSIWHWPTLAPRSTTDLQPQKPVGGWSSVF